MAFHSSNAEFSHYNIYRETNFFASVSGLTPIASGKHIAELQNVQLEKWIDKFPPTGTGLFYAITIVNHKGEETQNVVPKQVGLVDRTELIHTGFLLNEILLNRIFLRAGMILNQFRTSLSKYYLVKISLN